MKIVDYKFVTMCAWAAFAAIALLISCSNPPRRPINQLPEANRNHNRANTAGSNQNRANTAGSNQNVQPPNNSAVKSNSNPGPNVTEQDLKPDCVWKNFEATSQSCQFLLDGYAEREYLYEAGRESPAQKQAAEDRQNRFVKGVIGFIKSTNLPSDCTIVSVVSTGYADSQALAGEALKWSDVPEENCLPPDKTSPYLTNGDLAAVRECSIKNKIAAGFGGRIRISSQGGEDYWKSLASEFKQKSEQGNEYRKVSIVIKRVGRCR